MFPTKLKQTKFSHKRGKPRAPTRGSANSDVLHTWIRDLWCDENNCQLCNTCCEDVTDWRRPVINQRQDAISNTSKTA